MTHDEMKLQFMAAALQGILSHTGWHPDFILPEAYKQDAGRMASEAVTEAARKYADAAVAAFMK